MHRGRETGDPFIEGFYLLDFFHWETHSVCEARWNQSFFGSLGRNVLCMFAVYHSVFALRWLHMILYSVLVIVLRVVHNLTVYDEIDDICHLFSSARYMVAQVVESETWGACSHS